MKPKPQLLVWRWQMQAKLPTSFLKSLYIPSQWKKEQKKKKKGPNYQKGEKKKDAHHALSMNLKKALSHTTKYASIKEFFLFFFHFCMLFFSWENDIDDQKNEKNP